MGNVDRYNEFSVGDVVVWERTYKEHINVRISDLARFDDFCRAKISNADTGEDYGWVDVYVLSKDNVIKEHGFKIGDRVIYDDGDTYYFCKIADIADYDKNRIFLVDDNIGWVEYDRVNIKKDSNVKPDKKHTNSKQLAAAESLRKAASIVEEREKDYGDPTACFGKIAEGWGLILNIVVKPHEVALMMDWLKTVRLLNDPTKSDSWQDKAGYSALGEQLACGGNDD